MSTKSFTTGDIVRFESGTLYRVLGYEGGMLQVRGQRQGKDFGAVRLIDPGRTELVSAARHAPEQPVEAPPAPPQTVAYEPRPATGSMPTIRASYWDTISQAESTLHRTIHAARLGMDVKDAVDRIVTALAEGTRPDPEDYEPIRNFVDHIDTLD